MSKAIKKSFKEITPKSRKAWRTWLEKNFDSGESVWLILAKKNSGIATVGADEAVEEALCFGWIDSVPGKVDDQYFKILMSPRNPKSNWSKVNKDRVEKLIKQGLMTEAGLQVIEAAKKSGTWTALDNIENLVYPDQLKKAFTKNKLAKENFENFPKSVKRGILEWIINAKKEETQMKRITETVSLAEKNLRANQYIKKA